MCVSLFQCDPQFSYKSANKPDDPHAVNNHNGINFLFFNHNLRRLLLFTIKFYVIFFSYFRRVLLIFDL